MPSEETQERKSTYDDLGLLAWEVDVIPPDSTDFDAFRFRLFSEEYKRTVGLGHEEMAGKMLAEALPESDTYKIWARYAECVDKRERITYTEYLEIGGKKRGWRTTLRPLQDDNGQIYRLIGSSELIVPIEAELREAIKNQELAVHYQPICRIDPCPENPEDAELIGYEALLRWPNSGYTPADFIPVAKAAGIMAKLTRFVIFQVGQALKGLPQDLWISINVSNCNFVADLLDAQRRHRFDPDRIRFEVTEDTIMDELTLAMYQKLQLMDFLLELDDFGTSSANMEMFAHLHWNAVKLDVSFVRGAWENPNKAAICRAAINMCRELVVPIEVICEGIETQEDLQFMAGLGATYGQGWLLGKPKPLDIGI